jgi:hypothetical protein
MHAQFRGMHARISLRSNSAMAANAWKFSLPNAELVLICANCRMRLLAESGSVPSIKANTSGNCLGRPDISLMRHTESPETFLWMANI